MLMVSSTVRIFLATQPTDLRRSFDRLAGEVQHFLGHDPLSGDLFAFRNRRGDRIKILYFDRSGWCLWYKRLEAGTFRFPAASERSVAVSAAELTLLLEGIEVEGVRRRKRFTLRRPDVSRGSVAAAVPA
jgi:transposase